MHDLLPSVFSPSSAGRCRVGRVVRRYSRCRPPYHSVIPEPHARLPESSASAVSAVAHCVKLPAPNSGDRERDDLVPIRSRQASQLRIDTKSPSRQGPHQKIRNRLAGSVDWRSREKSTHESSGIQYDLRESRQARGVMRIPYGTRRVRLPELCPPATSVRVLLADGP